MRIVLFLLATLVLIGTWSKPTTSEASQGTKIKRGECVLPWHFSASQDGIVQPFQELGESLARHVDDVSLLQRDEVNGLSTIPSGVPSGNTRAPPHDLHPYDV